MLALAAAACASNSHAYKSAHCPGRVPGRLVGTNYGGYLVPSELSAWLPTAKDKPLIIYSFGLGLDVSFDLGITSQLNALGHANVSVHQFDPTPRAIKFVGAVHKALREGATSSVQGKAHPPLAVDATAQLDAEKLAQTLSWAASEGAESRVKPQQLTLHRWGLGTGMNDESAKFYLPGDSRCVSATTMTPSAAAGCGGMKTNRYFTATLRSIETSIARLGHASVSGAPHVLKIDVEGAELSVLRALLDSALRPRMLLVYFDTIMPSHPARNISGAHSLIKQLQAAGYVQVEGDPRAAALSKRHMGLPERTFVFCGGAQPARSAPAYKAPSAASAQWPAVRSTLTITRGHANHTTLLRNGLPVWNVERHMDAKTSRVYAAHYAPFAQNNRDWTRGPAMLSQEVALIDSYLYREGTTMLEWGSGGSTLHFSKLVGRYYSIEDNAMWANRVSKQVAAQGLSSHVTVASVKPDRSRGVADGQPHTRGGDYSSYCAHVEVAAQRLGVRRFDFVLIDGRARQWCAKSVLPFVDTASRVFVHDFFSRSRYWSVFDDFYEVASVKENGAYEKGLVVLQKRP